MADKPINPLNKVNEQMKTIFGQAEQEELDTSYKQSLANKKEREEKPNPVGDRAKKKYKINVDLDSAKEEAEDLESRVILADDDHDADIQAMKIVKDEMYSGPYYNVTEVENEDGKDESK